MITLLAAALLTQTGLPHEALPTRPAGLGRRSGDDDLTAQIARIERKMLDVAEQLKTTDPDRSGRLLRGVKLLRERAAAWHAESIAEQAGKGNVENAARHRASVVETLKRLLALLEGRVPGDEPENRPIEERLADLRAILRRLLEAQDGLIAKVRTLDRERGAALSREQVVRVRALGDEQGTIASELDEARRLVMDDNAMVFRHAVDAARDDAGDARDRLREGATGAAAQDLQESVANRLRQILEALDDLARRGARPGDGPGTPGDPGDRRPRIPDEAELRLILGMQQELYRRTQNASRVLPAGGDVTPAQKAALKRLSDEQGSLARLLKSVMERAGQ